MEGRFFGAANKVTFRPVCQDQESKLGVRRLERSEWALFFLQYCDTTVSDLTVIIDDA